MFTTAVAIYVGAKYDAPIKALPPMVIDLFAWSALAYMVVEGGLV